MGVVLSLDTRRSDRLGVGQRRRPQVTFAFDLASPFTYLAAERVDQALPAARWCPVPADALHQERPVEGDHLREIALARARLLQLPLVWPDAVRVPPRAAMRVASLAAERGHAAAFVLAAGRLAFCGGFDLEDPETLAEAAAAAALPLEDCLQAAGDVSRDGRMERDARSLLRRGADRLPLVSVGSTLFCGEEQLGQAVLAARCARVTAP